ncbi:TetR/AcrR family transcriptional regulator [Pseudoroseomonas cervicalis]|uniref:TetR/AcrR family transcriptional regulator n=1 Tax=Teichococcus cervicalis TaxID=204525 RepID=UPI0022F17519|nr:TetR/AcrR family transcriptional regulator [Pseudoroseomonas cervicalis]WBV44968.1 helix-turn-helix domain containing protein [Pseudoroseomonas cervicalis]
MVDELAMSEAERDAKKPAGALRADARRNRARLLDAARALLAEQALAGSLEAVARRAGVGIGTLYRHFPTREALVEGLYRDELEAMLEAGGRLSASLPPDEALAQFLQRSLDYMATKRGLGDSLRQVMQAQPELMHAAKASFPDIVARMVGEGVAAGRLRPDAEAEDVMQTLFGLYHAPAGPEWRHRAGRIIGLLVEGMRQRPAARQGA